MLRGGQGDTHVAGLGTFTHGISPPTYFSFSSFFPFSRWFACCWGCFALSPSYLRRRVIAAIIASFQPCSIFSRLNRLFLETAIPGKTKKNIACLFPLSLSPSLSNWLENGPAAHDVSSSVSVFLFVSVTSHFDNKENEGSNNIATPNFPKDGGPLPAGITTEKMGKTSFFLLKKKGSITRKTVKMESVESVML